MIEANGPLPGLEWTRFPEKIKCVAERLIGVQIENQTALKLLERYNRPNVLIYADPPYVLNTRTTTSYRFEMSDNDHIDLIEALNKHTGPVLLSGYTHQLYENLLQHWKRTTRAAKAENGSSRIEVLWINPIAAAQSNQMDIFDYTET